MMRMHPTVAEIAAAINLAARAPSVHNTQPWRWRVTNHSLDLYADSTRQLEAADPRARLLTISCGATLHHLAVAMRASGFGVSIKRLPDPDAPDKLACITFMAGTPDLDAQALAMAILDRRTDRRPTSFREVPPEVAAEFEVLAHQYGAQAHRLDATGAMVWNLLARKAAQLRQLASYREELYVWTHRDEIARDGIPAANRVSLDEVQPTSVRRFAPGSIPLTSRSTRPSHRLMMLIATSSDSPLSRLRAGEAMSAVLLEATRQGLATSIYSQVLEMDSTRALVEKRLLEGNRTAQVLLNIGWPSSADPLPATPRRAVHDMATYVSE